jgi:general secretion pathway protein E
MISTYDRQKSLDKFWDALVEEGMETSARNRVERVCAETGTGLPVVIAQLGLFPDGSVVKAYQRALNLPRTTLKYLSEVPILGDINIPYLRTHRLLPLEQVGEKLSVAMVDPLDMDALTGVGFATGFKINPTVIALTDWQTAFDRTYGTEAEDTEESAARFGAGWADDAQRLKDLSNEAPIVRKVDRLLTEAVDKGTTDIHVEPAPNITRIRIRIDGALQALPDEAPELAALLVSRVKVLCDMDVADRRRPQDGRTSVAVRGRPIDLRVSTVPTAYGESMAIRILDRATSMLDLSALGFSEYDRELIETVLKTPKGIFLVTGPTGSGKTTTLYAALNKLRQTEHKILTVEDPIEYFFEDVNQVQVNEAAGVSFATTLRSFLRQDPDILMVGEIRDTETARIAVQAALTGHLVLSTLHTNDAVSSIARLKDMGIEDYMIAATLSGVTAQRLVRKKDGQGRTVIAESFLCSPSIAKAIRSGAAEEDIVKLARKQGMVSLRQDGEVKAKAGKVSLDDVYVEAGQN